MFRFVSIKRFCLASIVILFCFLGNYAALAQGRSLKKAGKKFDAGEFETAIKMYKKISKPAVAKLVNYQIAESYRLSNRINKAEPYYKRSIDAGVEKEDAQYHYAHALKANEKYSEAEEHLVTFLTETEDPKIIEEVEKEIKNLKAIEEIVSKKSFYEIENFKEINTSSGEYAPVFSRGYVYFTSDRHTGKVYKATGNPFSDVYKAKYDQSGFVPGSVEALEELFNDKDINDGTIAFTNSGKTMVFGKGNDGKKKGDYDVNLFVSYFRKGEWTTPKKLPINKPKSWDSTPAFNRTGRIMYFASNRPGGQGGLDIWSAKRDRSGRWGGVKNLGPKINTSGNEMFPFVNRDGILYFSSTGHPGLGGLDLFRAVKTKGEISIENLGIPINSSADDFGLSYAGPLDGFFTSNRESGLGDDDIYKFVNHDPDYKIVNYVLSGKTISNDANGNEITLPSVRVRLLDESGSVLERMTTKEDGAFKFVVNADENYILIGDKSDYFTTRELYSTVGKGLEKSALTQFETNVVFDTLLRLDPIVLGKEIVLDNIYYDLDKSNIRSDAALELDKLVSILEDNPEIKIELSSHTDSRADDNYNKELSQRRAESAVAYIISKGIFNDRITAKGYGEDNLIVFDAQIERLSSVEDKEKAHQRNRRTEFKVVSYEKRIDLEELEFDGEEEVSED